MTLKAHPAVRTRLESVPASSILVSPIVLGEFETGVEKSAQVERNRTRLNEVVGGLAVPALDAAFLECIVVLDVAGQVAFAAGRRERAGYREQHHAPAIEQGTRVDLFDTADQVEGVTAFLEKRAAQWKNA